MENKIIRQGHKINALNSANLVNIENVEFNMWCITYTMTLTTGKLLSERGLACMFLLSPAS